MTTAIVHLATSRPVRDLLGRVLAITLAALAIFVGLPVLARLAA